MDESQIKLYMSMIGELQWLVTIGRFDIHTAVMTMSRFRAAPRVGHLERLKRMYGYVKRRQDAAIRFRTGLPSYDDIDVPEHDWMYTVYGNVKENIPDDTLEPKGGKVVTTTYIDANLLHDLTTGRAATGILHFVNGTPIKWFSKRQNTVETATYGSEFVAARVGTDQIIDLRTTLCYLGVEVEEASYMFGDNQSVITSSTLPHSALNKRHNALCYHRVREAVATGIVKFIHMFGESNPAYVLSKHCSHLQFWPLIKPILSWRGAPAYNEDNNNVERCLGE